ncbi:MAG: HAD hydrolase-like protein [Planctomycetota bacterium]
MRTLLFDIDGTLLTSGVGARAFARAFESEFGITKPDVGVSFAGRTDRSLMLELLTRNSLPRSQDNYGRLRRQFVAAFHQELNRSEMTVLTGVRELLSALSQDHRICVSVMTGNLPETATLKLEHAHLRHLVKWIQGGDLDENRDDMAFRAWRKISRNADPGSDETIVVIGDTPADVQCGQAIKARTIAVATGPYDEATLAAANPWKVVPDMSDTAHMVRLLTGDDLAY